MKFFTLLLAILVISNQAFGAPITANDVQKAQSDLLFRVAFTIRDYAKEIDMEGVWVDYCQSEMHLHRYQHPTDGQIPFGINYNSIDDSDRLELVINTREAFEIGFLKLCLARAKNDLAEAARP